MSGIVKVVWRRGEWTAEFRQFCDGYECEDSPAIALKRNGDTKKHWHLKRWLHRDRTGLECLGLAIQYVTRVMADEAKLAEEGELLAAEADAIAEVAAEFGDLAQ